MAIRQYIGARYVPKFFENPNNTSEWLPNVEYEPLTIVTYGLNTYTSKKLVPASVGDPSNNPDYWVATANFNAFVTELQNQIDDINDDIDDINDDIADLTTDTKQYVVLIGDSYVDNGGVIAGVTALLDTNEYRFVANALGGASFSKTDHTGYTSYKSILESTTVADPEKVNRVIIVGGYNEINYPDDIESGVNATVSYIRTRFPHAQIEYMPVGRSKSVAYNFTVQTCNNRAINRLNKLNCIVHDNAKWILGNANLMASDNVHPATNGYAEIIKYIVQVIKTKTLTVTNNFKFPSIGAASGLPFRITGDLYYSQLNDTIKIYSNNLVITKTSGTGRWTVAAGSRASFLDLPNFFLNNDATVSAPVNADFPFRQTHEYGSQNLKVQSVQDTSCFNVCNFGNTQQVLGVNLADDANEYSNMSSEFMMIASLVNQFPKYPVTWVGYTT